jgi:DNA polymerase-4
MTGLPRHILHVRLHLPDGEFPEAGCPCPPGAGLPDYAQVLEALEYVTPVVQPVPPDGADLDVTGVLKLWDRDAHGMGVLVQLRLAALFALDGSRVGAAGNRMLAAMAADTAPPGGVVAVDGSPEGVASFLRPLPVSALPGVGPATARSLRHFGLRTVGALAAVPLPTLQRILGGEAGRALHERANGHDPRPVASAALPRSASAEHRFAADELDPVRHRGALLGLAEEVGTRLRAEGSVAGALALTVRYADGSASVRECTLDEPTAHSAALARGACGLYERLGLERARVRGMRLRAERLRPAARAARQLSFDPGDERARAVESAADRARARFGPGAAMPAALVSRDDEGTAGPGSGIWPGHSRIDHSGE